jgi:hypothetical protein
MSDNPNKSDWRKELLKGCLITIAVLALVAVVGFGLLVGFCALKR